ncbi:MAG: hypothetical protein LBT89_03520 [Planctomycetaceae bacterium]|jgi:DNA polymerase-3 subunit alpha|nr:hypothetical protein [Planctomycetaceae bacterium]
MPENKKSLHQRRLEAIIDETLRLIEAAGQKIDIDDLVNENLENENQTVLEFFHHGNLDGVVGGSLDGVDIKPNSYDDLAAILALVCEQYAGFESVKTFVKRCNGQETPHYDHLILEEILEDTYGVIIWKEQRVALLNKLGNIPLADARKFAEKSYSPDSDIHDRFIEGVQEKGLSAEQAQSLFAEITDGFLAEINCNLEHYQEVAAAAYSRACLKVHYPEQFAAALKNIGWKWENSAIGSWRDVCTDEAELRRQRKRFLDEFQNS